MAFQVSPGVIFTETDLTAGAQTVSVSDAAFAGPFQWGPALDPQDIGTEDDLVSAFGKPDDTTAPFWFSAASFLAYSDLLHVVRALAASALNATTSPKVLAGTVSANGNNFVGDANSGFQTTGQIVSGQEVVVNAETYIVSSIVNSTAFATTPTPDANTLTSAVITYGFLIKNQADYDANFSVGAVGYGAWAAKWAGELGNTLKVSVCSSANAFSSNPDGTLTLTAGSNTVSGSGTHFLTEIEVGDFIVAGGQSLQVTAIANDISLSLSSTPLKSNTFSTTLWAREWEYFTLFDAAPGTSQYVNARGGSLDEMHIVVVDLKGFFTGQVGTVLERFAFASKAKDAKDTNGDGAYYVDIVNKQSAYIWWLAAPGTNNATYGANSAGTTFGTDSLPARVTLQGGQTANPNVDDSALEEAYDTFKDKDAIDISLVITGPASAALAGYVIQNICELRQDCVAFVSPSKSAVVHNSGQEVASITAFRNTLPSSSYAFMDSGWKYLNDKYNQVFRWVPLNGDMAGLAAQTDTTNDPWFSPAGFNRGNVKNVIKLAWNPKQLDRDTLYKQGVNPVVQFAGQGTVLFGDKTMLARPSAFDRINVRRLFIVLEKTISRLAKSELFEFNDEFTRSQFRNIVEPYLRDVKARRGVIDYRVICDDTNNTDAVIEQNRFVGDIFIKPARSINFIQLNFVAVSNSVSFQEVTGAL